MDYIVGPSGIVDSTVVIVEVIINTINIIIIISSELQITCKLTCKNVTYV